MFQKILLCADGSDQALHAAHLVARLAGGGTAQVDVVHVLDPIVASGTAGMVPEAVISGEVALQYAEEGQQAILASIGKLLEQAHISHRSHAEFGHPVQRIHEIATEIQADLIVIGSRGLSAWPALLLGSVSEGVARHAPCPVLVVRGEPKGFERILIASDGSPCAGHAARAGMELAKECHADVTVLNVFQSEASYPGVSRDNLDPEVYAPCVEKMIACQVEPFAREIGVLYRLCQQVGHPAEALVEFAAKQDADLVVVGTRGLGGFKRLLMGSVSTSVLHHAHCSILVVR